MRQVKKKVLGPPRGTLGEKGPMEHIVDGFERGQLMLNQLAVRYMASGSGQFQSMYDRMLHGMLQKSVDMLGEARDMMDYTFGPESDFRKDMDEFKRMGPEIRQAVGLLWNEVKDSFKPYDPDKARISRESCEKDALAAFAEAAGAAHETISRGGYDVGPVSKEFMAVTYAHDVMDAAEACVGVKQKMSDSTASTYVAQMSMSDGYVLSGVHPGDSYSDIQQAFRSEIERTGERTFADCLADAARAARENSKPAPSRTARPACGHDLRGLELKSGSDGPDRTCSFD